MLGLPFAGINTLSIGIAQAQEQQPRTFRVPFHSVNNVFFWLLLGLAIAGTVWFLAEIVRVFLSEKFRRDVDRVRKVRNERRSKRGKRGKHLLLLGLLTVLTVTLLLFADVLFSGLAFAQEPPRTFRIPFHTARSLILVSVMVDGVPKTLIFDTGAERTLVNSRDANVERRVTFILGSKAIGNFPIILTDLSGMGMEKVGADGVLGEDVLMKFSRVRIDFKQRVVELEQ